MVQVLVSYPSLADHAPIRIDQKRGVMLGEKPTARLNVSCGGKALAQLEMNLVVQINATVRHVEYYQNIDSI